MMRQTPRGGSHGPTMRFRDIAVVTPNRCQSSAPAITPRGTTTSSTPLALPKLADVHHTEGDVHPSEDHQDTQREERSGHRHCEHHPGKRSGGVADYQMIRHLRCPSPLRSLSTLGVVAAWFRHCWF